MSKVLVTRGRRGGDLLKPGRPEPWDENAAKRQPMSRGRGTKRFGEHLGPLRRFLQSRVGCPWDDVYGEICRSLRTRGTVQDHVLFHLRHMVRRHVVDLDGVLHHHDDGRFVPLRRHRFQRFYVCPDSGRLCVIP